ncbi:hypothetical protein [Vibrio rhizosphaerae]|uniref:hypothetical protein n=1 Tax=Vibrio rhizosphaerae TaxID=398736 RepID=UPI0012FA72B4|nr:hypothetical protein [Vibrio rhizosphaerae]
MNTKKTSNQVASLVVATLQDSSAFKTEKSLTGSVLSQSVYPCKYIGSFHC